MYVVLCCVVCSDALPLSSVSCVWWISALPLVAFRALAQSLDLLVSFGQNGKSNVPVLRFRMDNAFRGNSYARLAAGAQPEMMQLARSRHHVESSAVSHVPLVQRAPPPAVLGGDLGGVISVNMRLCAPLMVTRQPAAEFFKDEGGAFCRALARPRATWWVAAGKSHTLCVEVRASPGYVGDTPLALRCSLYFENGTRADEQSILQVLRLFCRHVTPSTRAYTLRVREQLVSHKEESILVCASRPHVAIRYRLAKVSRAKDSQRFCVRRARCRVAAGMMLVAA